MPYLPLDQDDNIPPDAVQIAEVTVTHYMTGDGSLHLRTHYDGELPLSSILGLLAMGAIDIYGRAER